MALFNFFSRDVGIDLGTVNTLIAKSDEGIILREPSAVAVDHNKRIVAIGDDAIRMVGRTPGAVQIVHPLQEGVVADFRLCEAMLRYFIEKCMGRSARRTGIKAVLCVPGCVTDVEKRALEEAAKGAGAKAAFLLDEPVAAAIGAGLPVEDAVGSLVVDIGGGTTDSAVMALGGVVQKNSVRAGGTHIDAAILMHLRNTYGITVGVRTAEQIKLTLGSAIPDAPATMQVRGRDLESGLPRTIKITGLEIYNTIQPQISAILSCVREVLAVTPPELSADIYDYGLWLTGGGALLRGMAEYFTEATGIQTYIARHPLDCVAEGARIAAENLNYYKDRAV
ncbi:rod shape-determining protein [Christensenellaceae bacterium OttesenSCG-928-M15]|nr:rod shape-determining protein [Christensenellaceae bacterium OttesenSCG-928-M15]